MQLLLSVCLFVAIYNPEKRGNIFPIFPLFFFARFRYAAIAGKFGSNPYNKIEIVEIKRHVWKSRTFDRRRACQRSLS